MKTSSLAGWPSPVSEFPRAAPQTHVWKPEPTAKPHVVMSAVAGGPFVELRESPEETPAESSGHGAAADG
jgi:hypothetical protein